MSKSIKVQPGDLLLAHGAMPNPDLILRPDPPGGPLVLDVDALESYLQLLEFVVLYNRIVVVEAPYKTGSSGLIVIKGLRMLDVRIGSRGPFNLQEEFMKTLERDQIVKSGTVVARDPMPEEFVTMYTATPKVRNALRRARSRNRELSDQLKNELALAMVAWSFGSGMFLSSFAKRAQAPIVLSSEESDVIAGLERYELSMRRAVMNDLRARLDVGALKEIKRIEARGVNTVFPRTPLAWEIVREAIVPEDLLDVALDLRKAYKRLRDSMIEVDKIVLSDEATIQDKKKALREVEGLAEEIWPRCEEGVHSKVLKEASSLLELTAAIGKPAGRLDSAAKLVNVLSKPMDLILRALRRRRVKVLLKAKREFMFSKGFSRKIASVFDVPESVVQEAIASKRSTRPCSRSRSPRGRNCPTMPSS